MKAYIDNSEAEFSFHCLTLIDLESMLSAFREQIGKANQFKNHIEPDQKKSLKKLIEIINHELDNK